jgi:hypothetical protein
MFGRRSKDRHSDCAGIGCVPTAALVGVPFAFDSQGKQVLSRRLATERTPGRREDLGQSEAQHIAGGTRDLDNETIRGHYDHASK